MSALISKARVVATKILTPTVRWFQLEALDSEPSVFYAGQWLDLHIPDKDVIGGYSMCSSPVEFETSRRFDLAVKSSDHPAADWMHNKCAVGMELSYSFGGDVYLRDTDLAMNNRCYLLIAGGVGINPIFSMLQTVLAKTNSSVYLLYSSQSHIELMFSEEINKLAKSHKNLSVQYFITKEHDTGDTQNCSVIFGRRVNVADLRSAINKLAIDDMKTFICGPDEMITSIDGYLQQLGVPNNTIHYERWT